MELPCSSPPCSGGGWWTRQCSVPSGAQGRSSPSPAVSFPNKPASAADQSSCTCPATPPAGTLSPELNVRRTWGMEQGKKGEGDRKSAPLLLAKDQRQSLTWGSPNLDDGCPHKSVVSSHHWTPAPCGDGCTKSSGKRHLQDKAGSRGPTAALDWKLYQTRSPHQRLTPVDSSSLGFARVFFRWIIFRVA